MEGWIAFNAAADSALTLTFSSRAYFRFRQLSDTDMDSISLEDLALLEALVQVDQSPDDPLIGSLSERLVDIGLAEMVDGSLRLTDAGVERCKSLHHRVRADKEAAEVLRKREESDAVDEPLAKSA